MKKLFSIVILSVLLILPMQALADGKVFQLRPMAVQGIAGSPVIGINYPHWIDAIVLVGGAAQAYAIPTGAKALLFSSSVGCDFYVNYTTTATVPGASTSTGLSGELNPALRDVTGLTSISMISAASCTVTIGAYK